MKLTNSDWRKLLLEGGVGIVFLVMFDWGIISLASALTNGKLSINRNGLVINSSVQIAGSGLGPADLAWWGIILLIILSSVFLFWWLTRSMQRLQVDHLVEEMRYITTANPEYKVDWHVPMNSTIKAMIEQINNMTGTMHNTLESEREKDRGQKEFMANLGHDLRNPLTPVMSYLKMLDEDPDLDAEKRQNYIHRAYMRAMQFELLVDEFYEYTKSESAEDDRELPTQMELGLFFEQFILEHEIEADEQKISLGYHGNPSKIDVFVYPEKFVRIFDNLFRNAMKYGKGATFIKITARKLENNEMVEIRIANNGEPIPKSDLSKIFDRTYRVDKSRNDKMRIDISKDKTPSGSGLGLSIVQNFVKNHHGAIRVESNADITQFIITIPIFQDGVNA